MSYVRDLITKKEWYVQGASATPLLIGSSAVSGFVVKETIGRNYEHFLFKFQHDQVEMHYDMEDLRLLWDALSEKIRNDEHCIEKIRKEYDANFAHFEQFFASITERTLRDSTDAALVELLHTAVDAQRDSVGIGHLVEPLSIIGSDVIRERVTKECKNKERLHAKIASLFENVEKSFVTREEDDLCVIARATKEEQKRLLEAHQEKYYWLLTTYAGYVPTSVEMFNERMRNISESVQKQMHVVSAEEKQVLFLEMTLSEETVRLIRVMDICTVWQDERKENILRSIVALEKVLAEIARRSGIPHATLRYLGPHEVQKLSSIADLAPYAHTLEERRQGCYYLLEDGKSEFFSGAAYAELEALHSASKHRDTPDEVRGMTACPGTTIGRVRVCTTIESLARFAEGEVLVTHMTRPEYVTAMKKAAAIVTDEGGITCHAAIVARELGIPCIIGTKVATKTLKDGEMVEVRANHGYVRVIHASGNSAERSQKD